MALLCHLLSKTPSQPRLQRAISPHLPPTSRPLLLPMHLCDQTNVTTNAVAWTSPQTLAAFVKSQFIDFAKSRKRMPMVGDPKASRNFFVFSAIPTQSPFQMTPALRPNLPRAQMRASPITTCQMKSMHVKIEIRVGVPRAQRKQTNIEGLRTPKDSLKLRLGCSRV